MKADEQALLLALAQTGGRYPRSLIERIGMHPKRAAWVLTKWTRRGWYDWGVNILAGWLTDEGWTEMFGMPNQAQRRSAR